MCQFVVSRVNLFGKEHVYMSVGREIEEESLCQEGYK